MANSFFWPEYTFKEAVCCMLFAHPQVFNYILIFSGKFHCCNGSFTNMLTLLAASTEYFAIDKLLSPPARRRLCDRSVCHSLCHSVNRITHEHGNGRRPNLADMAKGVTL